MAASASLSCVPNATSTSCDRFALASSTRCISSYTANATISGKKSKVTYHNSAGPDIVARAQRKLGEKRHKEPTGPEKAYRNPQPRDNITGDTQESNKGKVSAEVLADNAEFDHEHSSTLPKKPSFEATYWPKDGKHSATSNSLRWQETESDTHEQDTDNKGAVELLKKDDLKSQTPGCVGELQNSTGNALSAEISAVYQVEDAEKSSLAFQKASAGSSSLQDPQSVFGQGEVIGGTSQGPEVVASGNSSAFTRRGVLLAESNAIDHPLPNERSNELERSSQIKKLAENNAILGSKIFYYPETPKAGSEIEIFLNRQITSLALRPNVLAMGAYNDWRWKSFVVELRKTNLTGDWWSCKLQIPKEAYKIDFVFFDGKDVYENNSKNDFFVLVEDGLQKEAFEDYLIEEKRKEAKRVAAEKAEEERRVAEEKRLAEEKAAEEADRVEARRLMNEQRESSRRVLQKAVKQADGLWYFLPSEFQGGDTVKLFYNASHRALASSKEIWIHGGYNNWKDMVSIVGKLTFFGHHHGDWWTIDVEVPKQAYVLNWVLADGPPERAVVYDNNSYQDFHALVPRGVPNDLHWAEIEQQIFAQLQEERHKREEAVRRKVEHTAHLKEQLKVKTKHIFLKSQAHIFYTDPIDVEAGKNVTIFYNSSNTILSGKPEVWLRGSFNRWTHRMGCFPPVKMIPAGNSTHFKATVKVPLDAYIMDFVFSERGGEDGGIYDNRGGLDYHVPVIGGITKEPPMQVVHISVEMAPIAKVGGLGDVVTSLSRAIQDLGHSVEVVLPKYDCLKYNHIQDLQERGDFFLGGTRIKIWNGKVEGLSVHFLEPENGMFWVGCVYGRRDDGQRFSFFCNAALEFLLQSGRHPDIIHCHDWSSAPVAWLYQESYKQYGLSNARVVFTIHNLEFGTNLIGKAMAYADKATTVSPTYASEVSGNSAIAPHLHKFHGIRNGIDLDIWDPYNDPFIPMSYTSEQVVEGKRAAKSELQQRLGLAQVDRPLVGIITRLTAQKGIHLIKHAIWRTLERSGQVVLLGSAPDPRIQNDFSNLANQLHKSHGDMARLCLHYDEPLSHLIYAGADFIIVPSMFEPCGLTQLTAMRYGAIPVVRRTGGLNDTVFDVDHDRDRALSQGLEPNGFSFDGTDGPGVDYALNRALSAWYDARDWFNGLCKQVMDQDWSWNRPALDYLELYYGARK